MIWRASGAHWARKIHAVGNENVEVQAQIEGGVEALDEGDRAIRVGARWASTVPPGAASLEGEDHAQHLAQRKRGELRIGGEVIAHSTKGNDRHRIDASGCARNHPVGQVRGGVVHAAGGARRADAAALAGERDQMLEVAAAADDAREAVREDAAAQIRFQLLVDVTRQAAAVRARGNQRTRGGPPIQLRRPCRAASVRARAGGTRPSGSAASTCAVPETRS